jgi:peptidyl-prolyl cis-trans isomerase A (cyclophilin A)
MKRFISCVSLLISTVFQLSAFTPTSDGIYAVLEVTYRDPDPGEQALLTEEIVFQFFYTESPVTSANFIGLAEGTLEWYDFENNEIRGGPDNPEPYFDGLFFHRIVPNFIIQTGSQNGLGTDGPGWRVPDEISPVLNHTGGGVVSMANAASGAVNRNSGGSQFFITMAQFPEGQPRLDNLNGNHSIFGQIIEGHLITQRIARAPTTGTRPLEDWLATIQTVKIIREGAGANAWDPTRYWSQPTFSAPQTTLSNNLEDTDGIPETADIRILKAIWERNRDSQYILENGNDLETWRADFFDRGFSPDNARLRAEAEAAGEDVELSTIVQFLSGDVLFDRRHFYRMLEVEFPPNPLLTGKRLVLNFDPIELTENEQLFITFLPEQLTFDFYNELSGAVQYTRSDQANMKPLGNLAGFQYLDLGTGEMDRDQAFLTSTIFPPVQAYLSYETTTSGSAYIYYPTGRPEGNTVTGTFSFEEGRPKLIPENKDLTRLILTTVFVPDDSSQDSITTVYRLDLYGLIDPDDEALSEIFDGNYRISRDDSEFIQTGAILYRWQIVDGQTYVILDFDLNTDFQVLLEGETSGSGQIYIPGSGIFQDATFAIEAGEPKPLELDKDGDKLILVLDLSNPDLTTLVQSTINIDFYDNFEGAYETTRTDSEVNQFGDVIEYAWVKMTDETRVDLVYDNIGGIPPMQVYLTPQPNGASSTGTAKVHFPYSGAVGDATYEYIVGGGAPRLVPQDKTDVQIVLALASGTIDALTIDILDTDSGIYNTSRATSIARPTGDLTSYNWLPRQDGTDIVYFSFSDLQPMQVVLTYPNETKTSGMAEVLFLDSGTVSTVNFQIGTVPPPRVSVNKTGVKLLIDLEIADGNTSIDTEEFTFLTENTGGFTRLFPENSTPTNGQITEYQWYENVVEGIDQVITFNDFLLDQQIFLNYTTSTSGSVAVYFPTSRNTVNGTFTITGP